MMHAPQFYVKFVSLASMINNLSHFVQETLEISRCCPVSHFDTLDKIYRRHCINLYRASTNRGKSECCEASDSSTYPVV